MFKPPGVVSARDLALWARKRGILSVYLSVRNRSPLVEPAWQVIRPGYSTDPDGPKKDRGHKTFVYRSVQEKNRAETKARAWVASEYGVFSWRRLSGFGTSLFPSIVVEEMEREYDVEIEHYASRHDAPYELTTTDRWSRRLTDRK